MTAEAGPADRTEGQDSAREKAQAQRPWLRLDKRLIAVDLVQLVAAQLPTLVAVAVFDVPPTLESLWPVVIIAGIGVATSVNNIVRWIKTRYRVTEEYVERRTGLFVRRYRSVRRDRIRSVDSQANLRMRVAGLRWSTSARGSRTPRGSRRCR